MRTSFINDGRRDAPNQGEVAASYGSMMLRSAKNREHFYGIGRWESREAWDAAQPGLIAMKLPGPMPESVRFFDEIDELTLATKPTKPVA